MNYNITKEVNYEACTEESVHQHADKKGDYPEIRGRGNSHRHCLQVGQEFIYHRQHFEEEEGGNQGD